MNREEGAEGPGFIMHLQDLMSTSTMVTTKAVLVFGSGDPLISSGWILCDLIGESTVEISLFRWLANLAFLLGVVQMVSKFGIAPIYLFELNG